MLYYLSRAENLSAQLSVVFQGFIQMAISPGIPNMTVKKTEKRKEK
jgi:hypothetical protein